MGIRRFVTRLYLNWVLWTLKARAVILGFDNANDHLAYCDSRVLPCALRIFGAHIGEECVLEPPIFVNVQGKQGGYRDLTIGDLCYIGKNVLFDLKGKISIADRVTISMGALLISHTDVGHSPLGAKEFPTRQSSVIINRGVYIGAGAIILQGVTIGECAVVGAGAVVVGDIPAHVVAVGVPARVVRSFGIESTTPIL